MIHSSVLLALQLYKYSEGPGHCEVVAWPLFYVWCLHICIYTHTLGTQKFPEFKKKYLKYLYKFETLVPFEVLPLRLDAAIRVSLPLLETLSNVFNRNSVEGRQRFPLNLCNVSKIPSFWLKTNSVCVPPPPLARPCSLRLVWFPWMK